MNNIINLAEHRKRRQLSQFIDMDELQIQREIALETFLDGLKQLNIRINNTRSTVKEWKR